MAYIYNQRTYRMERADKDSLARVKKAQDWSKTGFDQRKVLNLTTGEVYKNLAAAGIVIMSRTESLVRAIRKGNKLHGCNWAYVEEV